MTAREGNMGNCHPEKTTVASAFLFQTTFLHLGGYSATNTKTCALFLKHLFHMYNWQYITFIWYLTTLQITSVTIKYQNVIFNINASQNVNYIVNHNHTNSTRLDHMCFFPMFPTQCIFARKPSHFRLSTQMVSSRIMIISNNSN